MMPYKVGQKVVLLKGNNKPGLCYWSNPGMDIDVGSIAILNRTNGDSLWRVTAADGYDHGYWWHEEWIRHVGCPCQVKNCIAKHKENQ
jgi:hypothetical protein